MLCVNKCKDESVAQALRSLIMPLIIFSNFNFLIQFIFHAIIPVGSLPADYSHSLAALQPLEQQCL